MVEWKIGGFYLEMKLEDEYLTGTRVDDDSKDLFIISSKIERSFENNHLYFILTYPKAWTINKEGKQL